MDPTGLFAGGTLIFTLIMVCGSLLCTLVIVAASIGIPFYIFRNNQKRAQELMQNGTQGEATILSLQDTGMLINHNPRVQIELEIEVAMRPPYRVTKTMTLPMIRMSQVQVGSKVPVMVDLSDPTNPDKIGLMLK
jgi:preprotein translocase subunit YajC